MTYALLISVFAIASCGLVYELVSGALASYLLGDSITQFSTIIGTYLFAMGVGSYLSRYIGRGLITRFIQIEIAVGLVGGFSAGSMFLAFSYLGSLRLVLYSFVVAVGILVGLEIPLLLRILKSRIQFRDLVSQVLTFDYLGALVASLLFPLLLGPKLGLVRTCLLFGLLNAVVALATTWLFRRDLPGVRALAGQGVAAALVLAAGFGVADQITTYAEQGLYADEIIMARTTPYQRIIVTRWQDDIRLFLGGHLQFSSKDEYRYHEALVHPGLQTVARPTQVLVLGGGDGLAVREIVKRPDVGTITLVDLDGDVTKLFSTNSALKALNHNAFADPRVKVINADAFIWLQSDPGFYDFVVVDFPDPTNHSIGKLYTTAFYRLLERHLSSQGVIVVQSTSPLFARKSYWCVAKTIESVGLSVFPYHVYVPSFGEWGFVMASRRPYQLPAAMPAGLRFLTVDVLRQMFLFPPDMQPVAVEINRLDNQILVQYYDAEWHQVTQ
ncbi:MAG: polyamine aminopropyltransferase [Acidobacteriota bacterium]